MLFCFRCECDFKGAEPERCPKHECKCKYCGETSTVRRKYLPVEDCMLCRDQAELGEIFVYSKRQDCFIPDKTEELDPTL